MRRIFHLDLDAFFVSVERVLDPSLCGKPVIVGGDPQGRGVVACASYEARPYGIRAGMPLKQAARLCPRAIFLQGRFDHYVEVSRHFMGILGSYSPLIQPLGLDEAYLDMTGSEALYGPLAGVARDIKARVRRELGVTVSAGIASGKVAAKVASDAGKPDGLVEVPPGGDAAFLAPLPADDLPGIGPSTTAALKALGILTVGQLAQAPPLLLRRAFGAWGDLLHCWANGQDDSPVLPPAPPKSIGRSTTFAKDTRDRAFLRSMLRYLTERVGADLRKEGKLARVVVLTLRWADFTTFSRHQTLKAPADSDEAIYRAGEALMQRELAKSSKLVRLIGISVGNFVDRRGQFPLLEDERPRRLARAMDGIRSKYGYTAIQSGLTLPLRDTFPEERGRYLLKTACLSR
ncbi:MAG: DNA polymerase IV [Chloroflexi bacterium]|nr:DNA polymerase IV [Chloroflexota bacterium]